MNRIISKGVVAIVCLCMSSFAFAVPITLEGLGLETTWTDREETVGDMPLDVWGLSETLLADRVGIYVEYENGLTSWAVYSGISAAEWGICCSVTAVEEAASGFFAGAVLHGVGRDDLPMAWVSASNEFTGNFDLDYNSGLGGTSDWRASVAGWGSVEIALYSSARSVPEPGTLALLAIGLLGMGAARRRKKA